MNHLDFESRSELDLEAVGAYKYAMHPSTNITCMTFGPSRDRLQTYSALDFGWDWSKLVIPGFELDVVSAHNAPFEYAIYNLILHRRFGWKPRWAPSLWRCTMAKAAACGLPLGLDPLSRALGLKTPKDLEGRRVMLELAKPQLVEPLFGAIWDNSPEKFKRLCVYNRTDVVTEIEADEAMPDLSPQEQKIWELDLEINRRGVTIDLAFARKGAALAEPIVERLNTRLHGITCKTPPTVAHTVKTCTGVDKATRVAALKGYLAANFKINTDALDKEAVTDLLEDASTPEAAREILTIRRQVGKKNSIAKYTAAQECASPDGRARGLLQYHAAHTGRWGGRLLQPQNIPKGFKQKEQLAVLETIIASDVDAFVAKHGSKSMDALSDTLRALFIAAPGKQFVCADFNAIEARVLFWEAGEEDALNAYRRGESPYVDMARYIYEDQSIGKATHPEQYDIGKRTILGCGYQMGWKRFKANVYSETAKLGTPVKISAELAQKAVKAYRQKYAKVKALWRETENAAVNAVRDPAHVYSCAGGKVQWGMSKDRRFLLCRLPSGRFLRYWKPEIIEAWVTFCDDDACPHVLTDDPAKCPKRQRRQQLTFLGEDEKTKQWVPLATYGGALVENVTQAIARDMMAHGMMNAQAAGFDVLLTVHDEVLAECDHSFRADLIDAHKLKWFIELLCKTPAWAAGCPVAAEGWVGNRYHK